MGGMQLTTTAAYKAQKVVATCHINNGQIYLMNPGSWIAVDSDNNAIAFNEDGPSCWRTKTAANVVATTITGTPKTMKVYQTLEAAKAEVAV